MTRTISKKTKHRLRKKPPENAAT